MTFDRDLANPAGHGPAELLAPGHALLDAVVGSTLERRGRTLKQGAVLIDPTDDGDVPRLLVVLSHEITDGHDPAHVVSRRFQFVELAPDGNPRSAGLAPYLDYAAPSAEDRAAVDTVLEDSWLDEGPEEFALDWALTVAVPAHDAVVTARVGGAVDRVRAEVVARLGAEIAYSDRLATQLRAEEAAGGAVNRRPETEERRARDLERRLERRLAELARDGQLTVLPPVLEGAAVVVPKGFVRRLAGADVSTPAAASEAARVAIRRVMDAEEGAGRIAEDVSAHRLGYEVRSSAPDGPAVRIKVVERSGRDLVLRRTDVVTGRNLADAYRLAVVDGGGQVQRVRRPFDDVALDDFAAATVRLSWSRVLARAEGAP